MSLLIHLQNSIEDVKAASKNTFQIVVNIMSRIKAIDYRVTFFTLVFELYQALYNYMQLIGEKLDNTIAEINSREIYFYDKLLHNIGYIGYFNSIVLFSVLQLFKFVLITIACMMRAVILLLHIMVAQAIINLLIGPIAAFCTFWILEILTTGLALDKVVVSNGLQATKRLFDYFCDKYILDFFFFTRHIDLENFINVIPNSPKFYGSHLAYSLGTIVFSVSRAFQHLPNLRDKITTLHAAFVAQDIPEADVNNNLFKKAYINVVKTIDFLYKIPSKAINAIDSKIVNFLMLKFDNPHRIIEVYKKSIYVRNFLFMLLLQGPLIKIGAVLFAGSSFVTNTLALANTLNSTSPYMLSAVNAAAHFFKVGVIVSTYAIINTLVATFAKQDADFRVDCINDKDPRQLKFGSDIEEAVNDKDLKRVLELFMDLQEENRLRAVPWNQSKSFIDPRWWTPSLDKFLVSGEMDLSDKQRALLESDEKIIKCPITLEIVARPVYILPNPSDPQHKIYFSLLGLLDWLRRSKQIPTAGREITSLSEIKFVDAEHQKHINDKLEAVMQENEAIPEDAAKTMLQAFRLAYKPRSTEHAKIDHPVVGAPKSPKIN